MKLTAQELYSESGKEGVILELKGNKDVSIENIAAFSNGQKGDLVFVPDEKAFKIAITGNCSAMVIDKKIAELATQVDEETAVFISANIALSHAIIKLKYQDHDYSQSGWDRIHPSAVIHATVTIPESTTIGPNVIIEKGIEGNGDLTKAENLKYCYDKYNGQMDLITGDGGFDFTLQYPNQEQISTRLIMCQIAFVIAMQNEDTDSTNDARRVHHCRTSPSPSMETILSAFIADEDESLCWSSINITSEININAAAIIVERTAMHALFQRHGQHE